MSNEYKPTYVDNADNSISIMESTDTISFCKTGTKINTLSAKNVAHKKTGENLNLCAYDGSSFNPVITINNNHSDCRIMTNLNISGNVNIIGNGIINTSLGIGTTSLNNGFTGSNVHTNSILDINGQTTISGHILPSQTEQFDLGNAEYKIRHLFLSDNSLWIGDKHKIDVTDGTIKFRKRKTTTIPTSINAIKDGDADDAIQSYIKNKFGHSENPAISDIKLEEWHAYAQSKQSNIKIENIFKPGIEGDWDENDTTMDTLVIKNNIDVSGNLNINSTACINLPVGTEALRPANPIPGTIRYNNDTYSFEGYCGYGLGSWVNLSPPRVLNTFTSHTFTNCGATGRFGPTLAQMIAAYSGTTWVNNTAFFNSIQQGYQLWTVPKTGNYRIKAYGAMGGQTSYPGSAPNRQGKGAWTQGTFILNVGTKLLIIVGQEGGCGNAGSGGGATWVLNGDASGEGNARAIDSNLYCVAGGGGGEKDRNQDYYATPGQPENAGITQSNLVTNWNLSSSIGLCSTRSGSKSSGGGGYGAVGGADEGYTGEFTYDSGSLKMMWVTCSGGGMPYDAPDPNRAGVARGRPFVSYEPSSGGKRDKWFYPYGEDGGFGGGGCGLGYAAGGGGGYVGGNAANHVASTSTGGLGGSSRNNGTLISFANHTNNNGSVEITFIS